MGIQIVLSLLCGVCTVEVLILHTARGRSAFARLQIPHSGVDGIVAAVALGRCGKQNGGVRQRQARLRHAKLQGAVHAGLYNGDGLRIGKPDVLRCNYK